MILSYTELEQLEKRGVVTAAQDYPLDINPASIDVRLGNIIYIESPAASIVEFGKQNLTHLSKIDLRDSGYLLRPGQIVLASIIEKLDIPDDLIAHFILKSSVGRLFINQMQSYHADPGYSGFMTLELQNANNQHTVRLTPYSKIGQLVFHQCAKVPAHALYSKVGQYNNSNSEPEISKGVR